MLNIRHSMTFFCKTPTDLLNGPSFKWFAVFCGEGETIKDKPYSRRPSYLTTDENVKIVHDLVRSD